MLFICIVVEPWDYSLFVVPVAGIYLSQIYSKKDKVLRQAFFQWFYNIMFVFTGEWLTVNDLFYEGVIHLNSTLSRNGYTLQFAVQKADTIAIPEDPI